MTTVTAPSDFGVNGYEDEFNLDEMLVTAEQQAAEEAAGPLYGTWHLRTLKDAYEPREPLRYLVDGLLPCPSLSIVYGGPGSLKSMVLADLAVCVAAGQKWLEPLPNSSAEPGVTFVTDQAPVLWIDFDNGVRRTDERMEAFGRGRNLPTDTPIHYVSMPDPWFDASKRDLAYQLTLLINHIGAKLIVIDNLGLITGEVEENSGEMARVMGNLRWLCEETDSAVIVVHHQRKSSGSGDKGIRKGESLRGHSSIEASLDLALLIERKEGEDSIAIVPTKIRGFREHDIIGAHFTYEHREGTKDLQAARFYSMAVLSSDEKETEAVTETALKLLRKQGPMSQSDLAQAIRDHLAAIPGGKAPGLNKARGLIRRMAEEGEIIASGTGTKLTYRAI